MPPKCSRLPEPLVVLVLALVAITPGHLAAAEQTFSQIAEGGAAGDGRIETFTRSVPDPSASSSSSGEPLSPFGAASEGEGPAAAAGFEPPPPTTEALGEQRTLVSLVNFTNDPTTPLLAADLDAAILDESNPTSAASWIREVSYGRAWLTGSVMDWVSASYADSTCLLPGDAGTQQLIDELDPLIDFSQIDRWIVVIPSNPACGFVGISTLGKVDWSSDEGVVSFSRVVLNGPTLSISQLAAHELGHSLYGLQHANDLDCGTAVVGPGCNRLGADRYSVMGEFATAGHLAPPDKWALDWLQAELVDVDGPGGTFLLEPYETAPSGGIKVLRMPAHWPIDDYKEAELLYVSYRKPIGFDAGFPELATDGAMLHLDTHYKPARASVTGASTLLDAKPGSAVPEQADSNDVLLEIGQSFVDPVHGITIETLGVVGDQLEVRVTRAQSCGNAAIDPALFEACDGADLAGETCASIGFTGGTLACSASCEFDTSACGPAQCADGHAFDDGAQLCVATFPAIGPSDMGIYKNSTDLASARTWPAGTGLTQSRGVLLTTQNFGAQLRTVVYRTLLPFDTASLPDGAVVDSATLTVKHDIQWDAYTNTHPDLGDQMVLVRTTDPDPLTRALGDFGTFVPVDAPDEGAPRIDLGDDFVSAGSYAFDLNATGISWIEDAGITRLGFRTGYDVDDIAVTGELAEFKFSIVPADSALAGPELTVRYAPLPEPGMAVAAGIGALAIGAIGRGRRSTLR